jgi:hypothetical protein
MILKNYHEIVGTLESYKEKDDILQLVVKIEYNLELPKNAIPKEELDDCMDRKIGIFNNAGDYRLRKFPRAIENFKNEQCPRCETKDQCSKDGKELFYCLLRKINELSYKKKHN